MIALKTGARGIMDNMVRQFEYLLVVAMLDCVVRKRGDWMAAVTAWFDPQYIADPYLRMLYVAVVGMAGEQSPAEPAVLLSKLPADGSIFGKRLADLYGLFLDSASQGGNGLYYAQQVYDARRRVAASTDVRGKGDLIATTPDIDGVLGELSTLPAKYGPAPHQRVSDDRKSYREIMDELEGRKPPAAVTFGIRALDERVLLRPGVLCTVAAPTTCGKSVLLGQCVMECVKAGLVALLFTFEMAHPDMVKRWASYLSRQQFAVTERGEWIGGDRREWLGGMSRIERFEAEGMLRVFAGTRNVEAITAEASAYAAVNRVGLIAVDYLQIVPPTSTKNVTREQQVSHIANRLKRLATDLKVPVITASQLNDDGRLRESRDIANASDIVLKLEPGDMKAIETDMHIAIVKNRSGANGAQVVARWEKSLFTIRDKGAYDMPNYDSALAR